MNLEFVFIKALHRITKFCVEVWFLLSIVSVSRIFSELTIFENI